jgi:hypothetical protein
VSARKGAKRWQTPIVSVIDKIGTDLRSGIIDQDTALALMRDAVLDSLPTTKKEAAVRARELGAITRIRAFSISNDEQHEKFLRQVSREITAWHLRREVKEILKPSKRKRSQDAEMHFHRWRAVYEAHRAGRTWPHAYTDAAEHLKGTPYGGTARVMKESFAWVQRACRERQQLGHKNPA